jgi:hypothetical protein
MDRLRGLDEEEYDRPAEGAERRLAAMLRTEPPGVDEQPRPVQKES